MCSVGGSSVGPLNGVPRGVCESGSGAADESTGLRLGIGDLALVPAPWDIDEAVKEVRWAKDHGLRGILMPVMWGDKAPYHHPRYDPIWAVCQELEMVIHFHSGPAAHTDYFGP